MCRSSSSMVQKKWFVALRAEIHLCTRICMTCMSKRYPNLLFIIGTILLAILPTKSNVDFFVARSEPAFIVEMGLLSLRLWVSSKVFCSGHFNSICFHRVENYFWNCIGSFMSDHFILTYSSAGCALNSLAKTSRILSPTHRPLVNVVKVK